MLESTAMSRTTQDSWARTRETSAANLSQEVSEQKKMATGVYALAKPRKDL